KTVERVAVQEEVIEKEVNEEPRTEESALPVAVAVAPEEVVNKVAVEVEPAVVATDTTQEEKAEEPVCETPVPNGTDESSSVESIEASSEEMKPKEYQRLFTNEELDAMEAGSPGQEGTVLAGQEIAVEKEEYDKELEDRLFPLDEVELLKRVKKNAEAQKEPSLEDMATHLNLPVEVLERTKEASPDEMSSPEYWQEWFQSTLESSEEAKRANRDFKAIGPRAMQGVPGAAEVVYEDFGMSKKRIKDEEDRRERRTQEAALVTEADVVASISVPLDSGRDAALLVSPVTTTEEVGPSVVRSIARLTVYEMLKDYKNGKLGTVGPEERTPDREEAIKTPPVRDKMPLVDWELFRRRASCLAEKLALPSRYWDCLSKWTEQYYAENAPSIWDKLWDRAGRARASHSCRRKRRDRKRVRFDCSALYVDRAEAVGGLEMNPEDDEDVSHYVNVVGPLRHRPERKEKHGLVKVVTVNLPNGFGMKTDEEDECDFPEVVKGGGDELSVPWGALKLFREG
ncbi:hypothetical protein PR001_g28524, partial [Phytophthora rubi]